MAVRQQADACNLYVCPGEIAQTVLLLTFLEFFFFFRFKFLLCKTGLVLQLSKQYQVQDAAMPPGVCKTHHYKGAVRAAKCALSGTYM